MRATALRSPSLRLRPTDPCPICRAETCLAEIEPHPLHRDFEIHGYLCHRCGPVKSLVVLRAAAPMKRPPRHLDRRHVRSAN
jgi:hypothetical protein